MRLERNVVLSILAEHRDEIEQRGVRSIAIFGSVARNEARSDSDIDIIVEVTRPFGYFKLFELRDYLNGILSAPVDLFTLNSLRDEVRAEVLREAIRAA
ncbi:MAG TPA: nucleotidyltransferase family protein [Chloroflexota bacterium]|nr:nucleotidyltransferase family protein [Chloroflexota bacterium]